MSRTAAGAHDVAAAAAASGLRLLSQQVSVQFLRVDDELDRRGALGLGAVPDRELLTVLFGLPVDLPMPRAALSAREQRLLRRAPEGVVELRRSEVTRLLVPAVRVVAVTARGAASVPRLRRLSQFGSFAERAFVLRSPPTAATFAEAWRWGIGLVGADGRTIIEPEPFVVHRHTPATWHFQEAAHAELLRVGADVT